MSPVEWLQIHAGPHNDSHTNTHAHRKEICLSIHSTILSDLHFHHEVPEALWLPSVLNLKPATHLFESFAFGLSKLTL